MTHSKKLGVKFAVVAIACLSFLSCDVMSGVASFVNCKYEFAGFANPSVAGINLNNVTDVQKLGAASLLKLTAGILAGNLPLSATVNVKAVNPNGVAAQIAGLDWALDLNSSNVLSGTLNNQISIPANGGSSVIPLTIEADLLKLFKGESKDNIFKFINGLLNTGSGTSDVTIRIRPSVMIGGQKISTGFIPLTKSLK